MSPIHQESVDDKHDADECLPQMDRRVFVAVVIAVFATTFLAPPLLKALAGCAAAEPGPFTVKNLMGRLPVKTSSPKLAP